MPITPTVTVIGLATAAGNVAQLVDGNEGVGWTPGATRLTSLTDTLADSSGAPNVGKAFACIQYDFGAAARVPLLLVQTESAYSLSDCMLIGSDNPATVATDIVQAGDVLLGLYPRHQMTAGAILATAMKNANVSKRYLRMVFHGTDTLMTPDGTPTETGGSSGNSVWFDTGSGNWVAGGWPVDAVRVEIEGWGGGASGGESATANNGGATTCSTFSLTANGGSKSAITTPNTTGTPAPGGSATGGNVSNTTGGAGGLPTPLNDGAGLTGKGGDAPSGGVGGDAVASPPNTEGSPVATLKSGVNGAAPGGGGSGRHVYVPSGDLLAKKYPGGGAGGYFKHSLVIGVDIDEDDLIAYSVGAGGTSTQPNGSGANGRIKFSWF